MVIAEVLTLGQEALWVAVLVAATLLGTALLVGVVVGIVQAATSIQEMTLSFIPKLLVIVLALLAFGGWQITVMTRFIERIFEYIPMMLA